MNEIIRRGLVKTVKVAKEGCAIVIPIVASALFSGSAKHMIDEMRYMGNVDYDDAVRAILESNMFSTDKRRAVELVKREMESAYYKSVIHAVRSSMFTSDKIMMIETMNSKVEE